MENGFDTVPFPPVIDSALIFITGLRGKYLLLASISYIVTSAPNDWTPINER